VKNGRLQTVNLLIALAACAVIFLPLLGLALLLRKEQQRIEKKSLAVQEVVNLLQTRRRLAQLEETFVDSLPAKN
jgi:hypothetical protein